MSLYDDLYESAMRDAVERSDFRRAFMMGLCARVEALEAELKALRGDSPQPPPRPAPKFLLGERVEVNGWGPGAVVDFDEDGDPIVKHDDRARPEPHYSHNVRLL